jgi:hypothetical protein
LRIHTLSIPHSVEVVTSVELGLSLDAMSHRSDLAPKDFTTTMHDAIAFALVLGGRCSRAFICGNAKDKVLRGGGRRQLKGWGKEMPA